MNMKNKKQKDRVWKVVAIILFILVILLSFLNLALKNEEKITYEEFEIEKSRLLDIMEKLNFTAYRFCDMETGECVNIQRL